MTPSTRHVRVLRQLIAVAAIGLLVATRVHAQEDCSPVRLDEAQTKYDLGVLNEVFDVLRPCVPVGFESRDDRVSAYRLMALSYLAVDSTAQARWWVERMVDEDASYALDPETDPPRFASMVEDAKPRWYSWLWRGNAWYHWAGRTAIVAGIASVPILLTRSGTEEPDLPLPPEFPPAPS